MSVSECACERECVCVCVLVLVLMVVVQTAESAHVSIQIRAPIVQLVRRAALAAGATALLKALRRLALRQHVTGV